MSLTIELSPEEEARLEEAARRVGVSPVSLARSVLSSLQTSGRTDLTLADGTSLVVLHVHGKHQAEFQEHLRRALEQRTGATGGPSPRPGKDDPSSNRALVILHLSDFLPHIAPADGESQPVRDTAQVDRTYGKYAGLAGGVDDFLREKHEETEREDARWEGRFGGVEP